LQYDGQSLRVSHETIYAYVYGPDGQSEELARYLPHRRKKRQPQRRRTPHLMNKLMSVIEPLPQPARKSITFDRGIEFRNWRKLKPGIGIEAWFCDPQAPWQKGSVENLNKRARRYLPRDVPVAALSNRDIKSICDRLNNTPRKCLGWRTPTEAFREELMKLR
jgi:IS30 family transposase